MSTAHEWRREEDGTIDIWVLDADYDGQGHNGPGCGRCGEVFCMHCHPKRWDLVVAGSDEEGEVCEP